MLTKSSDLTLSVKPSTKKRLQAKFNDSPSPIVITEEDEPTRTTPSLALNLSKVHSPSLPARVKGFNKGFQTERAKDALKAKVIPKPNGLPNPQDVVLLTDRINFAKYMILMPPQDTFQKVQQNDKLRNTFYSFKSLVDTDSTRIGEAKSTELFSTFKSPTELKKQLIFNKEQEELFRKTSESRFFDLKSNLGHLQKIKDEKTKRMPKIRIQPSLKYQAPPPKMVLEEDYSGKDNDDDNKNKIKYPTYLRLIKFGPDDCYNFHWQTIIESLSYTWKPDVVEGASLAIIGKYGYLYGGRAKDFNNHLARLDLGNN